MEVIVSEFLKNARPLINVSIAADIIINIVTVTKQ
jgi:hypothetical protein